MQPGLFTVKSTKAVPAMKTKEVESEEKIFHEDIFLIALSILALTVLIFIIIHSEKNNRRRGKTCRGNAAEEKAEDHESVCGFKSADD